jgi:membrane protease subunit HflK
VTARRQLLRVAVPLVALGSWGLAGLYSVESDESGLAYVLGRAAGRDVLPGIHWNPPWPLGRVVVEKTATHFIMPVGYRLNETPADVSISDLWLTGDTNAVTARLDIIYSIRSLAEFALSQENPRELLRRAGERVLTRFLLAEGVDGVLGTRRAELLVEMRRGVQEILDAGHAGIAVQSVGIQELAPPVEGEVRAAFQSVQNASSDRERAVLEARAYRGQTLAAAQGEAQRSIAEAQAARHRRIELAKGETERFLALARERERAPGVTETRLHLQTLERLLPRFDTYVVEPGENGRVNVRVVR